MQMVIFVHNGINVWRSI